MSTKQSGKDDAAGTATSAVPLEETTRAVIDIAHSLVLELHPERARQFHPSAQSALEKDLGIDSLARVELALRLERAFGARPGDRALMQADTIADIVTALLETGSGWSPDISQVPVPAEVAGNEPIEAATLIEALAFHVDQHGDRVHLRHLDEAGIEEPLTYRDLWDGAQAIAAGLSDRGIETGDSIGLMLPTGRDFFESFIGILLCGCVPVPIYPPIRRAQIESHLRRQAGILGNARARIMVTTAETKTFGRITKAIAETISHVVTAEELRGASPAGEIRPRANPGDTALLQYTSGSTGAPKGVVLSHANLLANIRAIGTALDVTSQDVVVSWLPLYHDMGLIGTWLGSLYFACPFVVLSPLTFLARPERWLWAVHRYRGTLSAAPNFAYELCISRIEDKDLEGLDLSSWRMAGNGAERVSPTTLRRFCERFEKHGFQASAMTPMYGLAENAVALTITPMGRGARIDTVKRPDLSTIGRAVPSPPHDGASIDVVSSGMTISGHELRVVDALGVELGDREVGRIEFRGPSATAGYLRNPDKTAELVSGGWLDTGDMGYIANGELFVTGRFKDIIIRGGRNLYPDELEEVVGDVTGVRKGRVAVFPVEDPTTGTEQLVILAETHVSEPAERNALKQAIVTEVTEVSGLPPEEVILAAPGTVVKTANGKIRRSACRKLYEAGSLEAPPARLWQQMAGLLGAGLLPSLRRWRHTLGDLLYAGYFRATHILAIPVVFPLAVFLPTLSLRRRAFRAACRFMLRLWRVMPSVSGLENLPESGSYILVPNHSSYLDGVVLSAVMPPKLAFVAKRDVTMAFFSMMFLRGIGSVFVERFDLGGSLEDARTMRAPLDAGDALTLFAEGTFDRRPGLRPFQLGAFTLALDAGVPIVPVSISGTRAVLRDKGTFPRRGRISVTIGETIPPQGEGWDAALALRDRTRSAVLAHCGEPDLVIEPTAI
jgi:1-acyl-sn-glycerol-3-phosphate acyltransferase